MANLERKVDPSQLSTALSRRYPELSAVEIGQLTDSVLEWVTVNVGRGRHPAFADGPNADGAFDFSVILLEEVVEEIKHNRRRW